MYGWSGGSVLGLAIFGGTFLVDLLRARLESRLDELDDELNESAETSDDAGFVPTPSDDGEGAETGE